MADKKRKRDWTDDNTEVMVVLLMNTIPSAPEAEIRETLEVLGDNPAFALRLLQARGHDLVDPPSKRKAITNPISAPSVPLPPSSGPIAPLTPRPAAPILPQPSTVASFPLPLPPLPFLPPSHAAPRPALDDYRWRFTRKQKNQPPLRDLTPRQRVAERWDKIDDATKARLPAEYVAAVNENRLSNVWGFPPNMSEAHLEEALAYYISPWNVDYTVWWPKESDLIGPSLRTRICHISVPFTAQRSVVRNALAGNRIYDYPVDVKSDAKPVASVYRLTSTGTTVKEEDLGNNVRAKAQKVKVEETDDY
ncbi:hypothetical protein F5Y18DRAFT_435364 [Xylariaceae sp. FL1019]|nr:hypothetical protein F5Y18DRAFT_435364 [Xylariaceae sp. FL1019]